MEVPELGTRLVNSAAVDLLVIEIVPLVQSVVSELFPQDSSSTDITSNYDGDIYSRIEGYGYNLGRGLSEIFTRDRPKFKDQLDIMKFVCRDLWPILYKKQIDNLKTNHRGTFVLTDTKFKYCQRMSSLNNAEQKAEPYLYLPAGIIRGALAALGVIARVTAKTDQLPAVTFNIEASLE